MESPLSVFAELLNQSGGRVACISTSFVADPPAGFGHYVAVKNAAESLVRTVCRELPRTSALIARPPVLQTRWNDTPAGVPGSIPSHWAATHIIDALARESRPGEVTTLSEFPPIAEIARQAATTPPDFSIRLAASFTTDPLLPAIRFWLKELELNAALEVAPYGQVLQSLLDPASPLNAKGRGFNVLLVRIGDWLHEFSDQQVGDTPFVSAYLEHTAQDFVSAVRSHRAQASSETLLLLCPSEARQGSSLATLVRDTEARVIEAVRGITGLEVATAAQYHPQYGVREEDIHDALRNEIGHIPFRDEYLFTLATVAVRHAHRRLAPVRKVVVVDCDNTLWRGVVGEVGADGVEFDEGHHALHRSLIRLAQNGVLVCLCSKNEESDVWRVFDTRDDLLLRREHVVAAMINWNPKSQNMRTLAARLNLGLDSFVFLDDNPVECAEVRSACPEVLTIEWPTQSDDAIRLLEHLWEFDVREATREDERRTELYREEFKRQDLRAATLTFEDFINSLQLTVDIAPLSADDVKRSAQLTLRTNQFNFTTIRREEADVQALASDGRHEIRTVRVRDRFGDYGLVGLLIAETGKEGKESDDVWNLDTFLLSCRVLGRGVEHRVMATLGQLAAGAGARAVRLRIEGTKRNTPARTFLRAIAPPALLKGDDRRLECEMPVEMLAAVAFAPESSAETLDADGEAPVGGDLPPAVSPPAEPRRIRIACAGAKRRSCERRSRSTRARPCATRSRDGPRRQSQPPPSPATSRQSSTAHLPAP